MNNNAGDNNIESIRNSWTRNELEKYFHVEFSDVIQHKTIEDIAIVLEDAIYGQFIQPFCNDHNDKDTAAGVSDDNGDVDGIRLRQQRWQQQIVVNRQKRMKKLQQYYSQIRNLNRVLSRIRTEDLKWIPWCQLNEKFALLSFETIGLQCETEKLLQKGSQQRLEKKTINDEKISNAFQGVGGTDKSYLVSCKFETSTGEVCGGITQAYRAQTRGADEGSTVFRSCSKCGQLEISQA
jgi:DNA-directed RNA polymerase subunit M/transcription elongation factor TFIIS